MAKYYVYTYAKPDGTIFYVGKGSGYRINTHENMARKGDDSYRSRVIRKVWREGGEVRKEKVFETDDEQEAFDYERMLTREIGLAYLTNAVEGGGGTSGWRHSEETLALLSKKHMGQKHTAEHKRYISAFMKEYRKRYPIPLTEEGRKKLAEAVRNREWTPEYHEAHSNGLRRAWEEGRFTGMTNHHHTQEAKDAIAEKLRGRDISSQTKQKDSEARKQWWNRRRSPENQLTWEKVHELRRLRLEGWPFKALGERYGITASSAYHIATYKTWKEE